MPINAAEPYRLIDVTREGGSRLRVLIYHARCADYVQLLSNRISVHDITGTSLNEEALGTVDVLLTWKCPDAVLTRLERVNWIQMTSAGMDSVLDFCRVRPDLMVTTTKGLQAESAASLVLLMVLAFHWRLPTFLSHQSRNLWMPEFSPAVISHSTCAILGLGHIGQLVAGHAKRLGMTVLGMRRRTVPATDVDSTYLPEQLHEMLSLADFVILALPLTERTRGLFGKAELKAMKRSAYLINVARGGILNERALVEALHTGLIAGAAVDVFEEEPLLPGNALWAAPNLVITPHLAGNRVDYLERAASIFAHNLQVFPDRNRMQGLAETRFGY